MGVCGSAERKKDKKNKIKEIKIEDDEQGESLLKEFKEELLSISDDQYVCICCKRIPEFQEIDCKKGNIVIYCPEHGRNTIEIGLYFKKMINYVYYNRKCENENCQKTIKESKKKFYHCFEDGKDYCSEHLPKNNNNEINYLPINEEQNKCILHDKDMLNYCITCNNNICSEIKNHKEDDIQFRFHNKKNHKIIERKDYKPKDDDLKLIYLFQKLSKLIVNCYEKYPKNYFYCRNITNLANFLKGNNILEPNDENLEVKLENLLDSLETKKKLLLFNLLFNCNISEDDTKINLKDKKIGDIGIKLLCKLQLNKLKTLMLTNNDISNIDDLKLLNSKELEALDLGYNNIRNVNIFKEVPFSLKELDLNNNRIENINIFENLEKSKLQNLKKLKLNNNNFDCQKNNKIMKSIQENMEKKYNKDFKFSAETNNNFSELIKQWDAFNNKHNTNIKLNDIKIDLSLINKEDSVKLLKQLKHENVETLVLNEPIAIDENIMNNYSKLNCISYNNGSKKYLKNKNIYDDKFKNNIFNLKRIKKIADSDAFFLSEYTFVVFNSIENNKTYLIYHQIEKEQTILKLKYNFDKDNPDYKALLKLENDIRIYQIRYYIDVHHQKDLIICSTNNSKIFLWEFNNEKLKEIKTITISEDNKNEVSNICVISDKKYKENYIITSGKSGFIKIFNEKGKELNKIKINPESESIFFINYYNHYYLSKYYIVIGTESGFLSFEFYPENNKDIKVSEYKNSIKGENKSAIIYSKDNETFLIGSDWKNGYITIFNFDVKLKLKEIRFDQDSLSYGLNLWNDQYLIVSCKDREIKKSKNESLIKIYDLDDEDDEDDEDNIKMVLSKPAHQKGVLSTFKIKNDNSKEYLISKGLDGDIYLWICENNN